MLNDPFFSLKPSLSNDPVAKQTKWTPYHTESSNVRTHRLVKVHPGRIEFRAACGNIIFSLIFIFAGVVSMVKLLPGASSPVAFLFLFTICPLFTFIGGWLLYTGTAPIVFDKQNGLFWRGHKIPEQIFESETETSDSFCQLELDRVYAVQLIDCSDYQHYYELNLILEDGNRVPIISYYGGKGVPIMGGKDSIIPSKKKMEKKARSDAVALSVLLDKPIWDKRKEGIVISFGQGII